MTQVNLIGTVLNVPITSAYWYTLCLTRSRTSVTVFTPLPLYSLPLPDAQLAAPSVRKVYTEYSTASIREKETNPLGVAIALALSWQHRAA